MQGKATRRDSSTPSTISKAKVYHGTTRLSHLIVPFLLLCLTLLPPLRLNLGDYLSGDESFEEPVKNAATGASSIPLVMNETTTALHKNRSTATSGIAEDLKETAPLRIGGHGNEELSRLEIKRRTATAPSRRRTTVLDNSYEHLRRDKTRQCSNPERDNGPWPYDSRSCHHSDALVGHSRMSDMTCQLCDGQSSLTEYLRNVSHYVQKAYEESKCKVLVTSVMFGALDRNKSLVRLTERRNRRQTFNKCFVLFILQEYQRAPGHKQLAAVFPNASESYLLTCGQDPNAMRVPLPRRYLPFSNLRRNVKLLKLHMIQIFSWAPRVLWLDAKFLRSNHPGRYLHYHRDATMKDGVCVSFMGMPARNSNMGTNATRATLQGHCHTVQATAVSGRRENLTDTPPDAIREQCTSYQQRMATTTRQEEQPLQQQTSILDNAMIDSALIAWSATNEECRHFLADLMCTWADEIHCHADRDQLSFPYALYRSMTSFESSEKNGGRTFWQGETPLVRIIDSSCHWYNQPSMDCFDREL